MPFFIPKGVQNAAFCAPFGLLLGAFWHHFAMCFRCVFFFRVLFDLFSHVGAMSVPCWALLGTLGAKKGAKSGAKREQNREPRLGDHLGSSSVPFWEDVGSDFGDFLVSWCVPCVVFFC